MDSIEPRPDLVHAACYSCGTKNNLKRCQGCLAVQYCGQDHQAQDRARHKKACNLVKYQRRKLAGLTIPLESTDMQRDYRRKKVVRLLLAEALMSIDILRAYEEAVSLHEEILRWDVPDKLRVYESYKTALVRLGRDQDWLGGGALGG